MPGRTIDEATLAQAVQNLRAELQPAADLTPGADTKSHLAGVLMQRALRRMVAKEST